MDWTSEYNVGVAFMDTDHEHAADLITKMREAEGLGLVDLLARFITHCEEHFAREEAMMQEVGFFAYEPHKGEHTRALDELRAALGHLQSDMTDITGADLSKRLEEWLLNHRNTMDQVTANFALERGFEG